MVFAADGLLACAQTHGLLGHHRAQFHQAGGDDALFGDMVSFVVTGNSLQFRNDDGRHPRGVIAGDLLGTIRFTQIFEIGVI